MYSGFLCLFVCLPDFIQLLDIILLRETGREVTKGRKAATTRFAAHEVVLQLWVDLRLLQAAFESAIGLRHYDLLPECGGARHNGVSAEKVIEEDVEKEGQKELEAKRLRILCHKVV